MSSNVLQRNPPHAYTHTYSHTNPISLPEIPFCNPPNNPHLHHYFSLSFQTTHAQNEIYFSRFMWAFWALFLGQSFFTEKTGNKARTFSPPHHQYSPFLFLPISTTTICLYPIFLYSSSIGSCISSFPFFPFCPYPFLSFFAGLINIHLLLPLTACLPSVSLYFYHSFLGVLIQFKDHSLL